MKRSAKHGEEQRDIIAYVRSADADFLSKGFNPVDSLVLSQFSYLNLDGVVPGLWRKKRAVLLTDVAGADIIERVCRNTRAREKNRELLRALGESVRFRNIALCCYVNKINRNRQEQFSAMTCLLEDGTAYVAFRGTDPTFVGWKEDFNMFFSCPVPAQEEAAAYLKTVGAKIPGRLRVGGHSKGGNLAVYAAMKCRAQVRRRILCVYNHDGPGFRDQIQNSARYRRVLPLIHQTMPRTAIIGLLMQPGQKYAVVKSGGVGIMQHDPYSWVVGQDDFACADGVSAGAAFAGRALHEWLCSLSDKKRALFADTLYGVIEATGARTYYDLTDGWREKARAAVAALREIDADTGRFMLSALESLFVTAAKALR